MSRSSCPRNWPSWEAWRIRPSGHFILDANAWDRGSQIWIINETADDDDWADWGGPVGYHAGHLHLTDDDARQHINAVADVGRVIIIGHGSGQIVRIVTFFSAATEDDWQWISIGVDIGDIVSIVGAHNTAAAVHTGQFTAVAANLAAHNQFSQAHADIRALITALQASGGLTFAAYSATATYSFGGSNSFVTHGNKLYFYRSTLSRSSNHDPGQHPGYWLDMSEGVTYQIIVAGGAAGISPDGVHIRRHGRSVPLHHHTDDASG